MEIAVRVRRALDHVVVVMLIAVVVDSRRALARRDERAHVGRGGGREGAREVRAAGVGLTGNPSTRCTNTANARSKWPVAAPRSWRQATSSSPWPAPILPSACVSSWHASPYRNAATAIGRSRCALSTRGEQRPQGAVAGDYRVRDRLGERRGHGVAELAVLLLPVALEGPVIGQPLEDEPLDDLDAADAGDEERRVARAVGAAVERPFGVVGARALHLGGGDGRRGVISAPGLRARAPVGGVARDSPNLRARSAIR